MSESGQQAAHPVPGQRVGRRALLGAGVGGAALSLLPFLSGRAGASATTDTAAAETTTTLPPQRPTADDITLLTFAQQVELTARALYDEALALSGWSDDQTTVVTTIREAHEAYSQSLAGLLGTQTTMSQDLFEALRADFAGDAAGVLQAAYDLESAAVATHLDVLATLQGTDGAALVASILSNEARYGTVLADLAGNTDNDVLLVDEEADSLVGKG